MSKVCQYATTEEKVCVGMKKVSLKTAQKSLQSCITWTKKSGVGRSEWNKACIEAGVPSRKLKTPVKTRFASKVVLFQEMLEYADAINICYRGQSLKLQERVPSGLTWAVARTVTGTLNAIVKQCILNQTREYRLLSDALAPAFRVSVELHDVHDQRALAVPALRVGNVESDIEMLKMRMAREAIGVLKPFLAFADVFNESKAHNMLALMLDPRFKGLECIIEYIGVAKAKEIVQSYDKAVLIPFLIKVHKVLNPGGIPAPAPAPRSSNVLFGDAASTEEACEGILTAELSLFRRLTVVPADAEKPLTWWKENGSRFPSVAFFARQILAIPGSQIETERIFSIASVLTGLRRCRLGLDNLDSLIMIFKNWPDDARHECEVVAEDVQEFYSREADLLIAAKDELEDAGFFEAAEDSDCEE
ncbi:hypothetical protein KC19_VG160100 [Ceratodon purpureus]|uniref:HAT C-terminal dimerisation domain-containing protein n=1 Tax=Ceratodon purpureus TaxID=3225 RepID=A0A8T0HQI2_CERPU|nr:hypothetical protein KC19_VG160100 [Ceratodon purpureus]